MNRIERLIEELCPQGVEFKALGEVGKLIGGSGLPKTDFTDSGTACIHYGQIYTHYGVHSDKTISFVSLGSAEKLKKVNQGDLIIAKTSENIEDICKTVAWLGNDEIVTGGHTAILKHKQNPKYLSYYINGAEEFQTQKRKYTTGVKVKDISLRNLAKIKIPIPPLIIQEEIVKILDHFTQLEAELEAELEARKKQYEYYRDALLTFGDDVEWKSLWMVTIWDKRFNAVERAKQSKVINYPYLLASALFALEQENGDVFLLSTGEQTGWTTEELAGDYICKGEVVTIPWGKSRAVQDVLKYYKGKFVTADNRIATSNNTNVLLNKFLYYWMMTQGRIIDRFYRGSGIKHPNMKKVLEMKIPIPSLSKQKEIVAVLDKFDALVNDISIGLPAEIAARKKQYEYYRDQLLTFKPLEAQDVH